MVASLAFVVLAVLFLTPDRQWVTFFSSVAAGSFFALGWITGSDQLRGRPLRGKVGVLFMSASVIFLAVAAGSSIYRETAGHIHEQSNARSHMPAIKPGSWDRWSDILIVETTTLYVHPYTVLPSYMFPIGVSLLIIGLPLKQRHEYYDVEKKAKHRLPLPKRLIFGLAPLLLGMSLLLFSLASTGYANAYGQFMSGKIEIPPAIGFVARGADYTIPTDAPLPLYVEFVFTPWLDCSLEFSISPDPSRPSKTEVNHLVFASNESEPVINITSKEVTYLIQLSSNIEYTFLTRSSSYNQTVPVVMSTKIEESLGRKALQIGGGCTIVGLAAVALTLHRFKNPDTDSSLSGDNR